MQPYSIHELLHQTNLEPLRWLGPTDYLNPIGCYPFSPKINKLVLRPWRDETTGESFLDSAVSHLNMLPTDKMQSEIYHYNQDCRYGAFTESPKQTRRLVSKFILDQLEVICKYGFAQSYFHRVKPIQTVLQPDYGIFGRDDGQDGGEYRVLKAIVQVKDHSSFPEVRDGDLISAFNNELASFQSNASSNTDLGTKSDIVLRPVFQLWTYMKLNNIRYGVLTNYNESFFFKRSIAVGEDAVLEVSKGIKLAQPDPRISIFGAWHYFISLILNEHSVIVNPSNSLKPSKITLFNDDRRFNVQELSIADLQINVPSDFKRGNSSILKTKLLISDQQETECIVKLIDGSEEPEMGLKQFETEIAAYKRLSESSNTDLAPYFHGCCAISGFCYCIFLEDCGDHITIEQVSTRFPEISDAFDALHSIGVVHNDTARRNVLVDQNYKIRIIDFGLSLLRGNAPDDFIASDEGFIDNDQQWQQRVHCEKSSLKEQLLD